jgi:hypothetical protein
MKIGIRKDSVFTDYNLRMPIIDNNTRQVNYQIVRYEFAHKNDSILEEKFKLVLNVKKGKVLLIKVFGLAPN